MTDQNDPDRVAEIRRALARLLDLLAREVVRQLAPDTGPATVPVIPVAGLADRREDVRGDD